MTRRLFASLALALAVLTAAPLPTLRAVERAAAWLLTPTGAHAQQAIPWQVPFPPQGRLTLCSGKPFYDPQPATPSSTDTSAETTTFAAAHGWCTGTMVSPSATGGGLTTGTKYFLCAVSTTAVAYYDTLAHAETCGATGLTNLTASITAEIRPSGIQSSTIKYTCDVPAWSTSGGGLIDTSALSCWVPLNTGTHWEAARLPGEISLQVTGTTIAISSLYNIYLERCGLTICIRLGAAWTGTNQPSEAITVPSQSGLGVLSGTPSKLLIGLIRAPSNDTFEDGGGTVMANRSSIPGGIFFGRRYVYNNYQQRRCRLTGSSLTSHTYNVNTTQAWNADGSLAGYFLSFGLDAVTAGFMASVTPAGSIGARPVVGIGLDSTTTTLIENTNVTNFTTQARAILNAGTRVGVPIYTPGVHVFQLTERAAGATTDTFSDAYLIAEVNC